MGVRKTILLIDDEVDLVDLVKFQLVAKGYNVVTANDGLEGLERLKIVKPDLIILDMNMPRMGGLEFYGKISTDRGKSKYPVLVLTARANLEKTFKDIAVDGFMSKPFEIDQLILEVERITSGGCDPVIYLADFKENPHVGKIKEVFSTERYSVVQVDDLAQLRVKTEAKKPAFIILEYMQRGMGGEDFIKKIKGDSLFDGVSVIVYSYAGFKEYGDKSLAAGADKYLGKPESYAVFVNAVKELELSRKKG